MKRACGVKLHFTGFETPAPSRDRKEAQPRLYGPAN
jgi:hypothetical protein